MLGLVLVTHAPLGDAVSRCVDHVMGSVPEGFFVVDVPSHQELEVTVEAVKAAAKKANSGAGVIFITDLFGATPSNAAVRAAAESLNLRSVLVSGCNLPMVLRALSSRLLPLSEVAERLVTGGRNGIVSSSESPVHHPTPTPNPASKDDSARNHNQQ